MAAVKICYDKGRGRFRRVGDSGVLFESRWSGTWVQEKKGCCECPFFTEVEVVAGPDSSERVVTSEVVGICFWGKAWKVAGREEKPRHCTNRHREPPTWPHHKLR